MKEFVLIFRHSDTARETPTAEQMKERMDWLARIAAENRLTDKGKNLSVGGAKTVRSKTIVTDGPYAEVKEFISGFMVLKAESIDEAVEFAKMNPIFAMGGFVEVREVIAPGSSPA
jgi:hypothetical protein